MKKVFNIKNINKKNQGFSLIELMIAVALIAILTSIIVTTASFSDTQKNLTLTKNELQAAIRLAQSYSLSIPEMENENVCGFGVEVKDARKYSIFYTYNNDAGGDPTACKDDPLEDGSTTKETIKDVTIAENKKVTVTSNGIAFFRAPYGDFFGGGSTFTLTSSGTSGGTRTIAVSPSGQIK